LALGKLFLSHFLFSLVLNSKTAVYFYAMLFASDEDEGLIG
jgi:hypothetical protein